MDETRHSDSGVTLIETLIVLVLIAVAAGIVTLSLPGGAAPRALAQEADLLIARLNLAADRSVTSGDTLRFYWRDETYGFDLWDGTTWVAPDTPPFDAGHALEDGITMRSGDGSQRGEMTITADLIPTMTGVQRLQLLSGTAQQEVIFDGARARVMP